MRDVVYIVVTVLNFTKLLFGEITFVAAVAAFRDLPHLFQETKRRAKRPRFVDELADAKIHLEEGEAGFHPLLERFAHRFAGVLADNIRVAIHANPIAELAAEHLVDRHAIRFAGQIPERKLDSADAAALTRMPAKLLDPAEQLVDIARVLSE
ncbi:hypothetical protein D3C74_294610 [compost metagenome]